MEQVNDIGEFKLIERITKLLPQTASVVVGPGDDAAIYKLSSGQIVAVTCDMLIEGIHFDLNACLAGDVGWRAMTASLSDIAAMGCKPLLATISIGMPQNTPVATVEQIYDGLARAAREHAVAIVGGDTVKSPERIVIDVSMIGEPVSSKYLTRSGASDGNAIVVTGYPGQSAAGLEIALSCTKFARLYEKELLKAHLEPCARVEQGLLLAQNTGVTAAIDLSDGLVQDLGRICEMSHLGAVVDVKKLPVSPHLAEYSRTKGENAMKFCLSGAEDYELVFTVHPDSLDQVLADWQNKFDVLATAIGYMTNELSTVHLENADEITLNDTAGYDHFRPAPH